MLKLLILLGAVTATPHVAHCQMRHHFPAYSAAKPKPTVVKCAPGEGCDEKWVFKKPLCARVMAKLSPAAP